MTTCEQCGADAVDAQGQCLECGWRSPRSVFHNDDSSPSLGETRAADIPAGVARPSAPPAVPVERTSQMPQYAPASQPRGTATHGGPFSQTATSRYCGTCGARIEGGEAFCGQCGTPVGMATGDLGTSMNLPSGSPSRYQVGSNSTWTPAAGDAPTEAFVVSQRPAYQRQPTMVPYGQAGYPLAGAAPASTPADSSRTLRMVFGLLCIAGSLISAAAAVILAIQH